MNNSSKKISKGLKSIQETNKKYSLRSERQSNNKLSLMSNINHNTQSIEKFLKIRNESVRKRNSQRKPNSLLILDWLKNKKSKKLFFPQLKLFNLK